MQVSHINIHLSFEMMQVTYQPIEIFFERIIVLISKDWGALEVDKIISVNHLNKNFKDVKAVDDVSFSVEKGELFGFLGENGAGKSTTINMLCTLYEPTSGEIRICGCRLGKDNEEIKRRIGVVYQNNCLDALLTVKENLMLRGSLYESDKITLKKKLDSVCEILQLDDVLKRTYRKLSGGQKRRCEIAAALIHAPEILFLDEPTTGLDPATRKSVWKTIERLQSEMQMTVFLTTHYMEEAAKARHIGIMEKGRLIHLGTPFELKEKFARDKLIIMPKQGKRQETMEMLHQENYQFRVSEERILIPLSSTMAAVPLITRLEACLEGFEVLQGTMDDVFLNVTREEGKAE